MKKLRELGFLEDQRGGGTVFGLLWFMLLVGICGLAVDSTAGLRNKTMLQATADSAALAASIDLPDDDMADGSTLLCAEFHLSTVEFGAALRAGGVDFGTWDPGRRTFIVGETRASAERLRMIRYTANGNAGLPASCGSSG